MNIAEYLPMLLPIGIAVLFLYGIKRILIDELDY
jgi:hypothetical protein